jgi:hypothetical protein
VCEELELGGVVREDLDGRKTIFEGREERKNFRFNQIGDLDKLSKSKMIVIGW